jgi:glycosyltransferase involved in cell wall biosynthesis
VPRVGFATADWSAGVAGPDGEPLLGGAGWYRIGLPARYLRSQGWEVHVGHPVVVPSERHLALSVQPAGGTIEDVPQPPDVIVMQRIMHVGAQDQQGDMRTTARIVELARAAGQVIINDLDDWFFGLDPRNGAAASTDPRRAPLFNRDHYAHTIEASTAVTCSTPALAALLHQRFPRLRIHVLRNAIDLDRWTAKEPTGFQPTVGWVGSITHRSGDLQTPGAQTVGQICKARGLRFHHSGYRPLTPADLRVMRRQSPVGSQHLEGSAGEQIGAGWHTELPMATILDYPTLFAPIDVGIVPLTDVAFNHSKSCIKAMEYAASGIPSIAQALPEQRWAGSLGLCRTAEKPKDWRRELSRMVDDPVWRAEQAEVARAAVGQLDLSIRGKEWADLYATLSDG